MKKVVILMDDLTQQELGRFPTVGEAIASPKWTQAANPVFVVLDTEEEVEDVYDTEWRQVRDAAIIGAAQAIRAKSWGLVRQLEEISKEATRSEEHTSELQSH